MIELMRELSLIQERFGPDQCVYHSYRLPLGKLESGESYIDLITIDHYCLLPPGTELISITGDKEVVGEEELEHDTRGGGFIASGFPSDKNENQLFTGGFRIS